MRIFGVGIDDSESVLGLLFIIVGLPQRTFRNPWRKNSDGEHGSHKEPDTQIRHTVARLVALAPFGLSIRIVIEAACFMQSMYQQTVVVRFKMSTGILYRRDDPYR